MGMHVEIDGMRVWVMMDCGAQTNVVAMAVVTALMARNALRWSRDAKPYLTTVSGRQMTARGRVELHEDWGDAYPGQLRGVGDCGGCDIRTPRICHAFAFATGRMKGRMLDAVRQQKRIVRDHGDGSHGAESAIGERTAGSPGGSDSRGESQPRGPGLAKCGAGRIRREEKSHWATGWSKEELNCRRERDGAGHGRGRGGRGSAGVRTNPEEHLAPAEDEATVRDWQRDVLRAPVSKENMEELDDPVEAVAKAARGEKNPE